MEAERDRFAGLQSALRGPERRPWFESIRNGYTLAFILHALLECGALKALRDVGDEGLTCNELAEKCGLDAALLSGVLNYLVVADSVVVRDGEKFRLGSRGTWAFDEHVISGLGVIIDAYGCVMQELLPALKKEKRYGVDFVRSGKHVAEVSIRTSRKNQQVVVRECNRLGITKLVDLGCGAAGVIIALLRSGPKMRCVGLEIDDDALNYARDNVVAAGLADRVAFVAGDMGKPEEFANKPEMQDVQAFNCIMVLHELLRNGEEAVVDLLRRYKKLFPGRYFFLGEVCAWTDDDYRKTDPLDIGRLWYQHLMHPLSLQGLPVSHDTWMSIFSRASVEFIGVTRLFADQYVLKF